jgi:hypothetical protein
VFALPQPDSPAGPPSGRGGFGAYRGARAGRHSPQDVPGGALPAAARP